MSVEKMEEYKKYKANRKEILRKEKKKQQISKVVGRCVLVLLVCVVVFGVYKGVNKKNTKQYASLVNWNQYIKEEIGKGEQTTEEGTSTETETKDSASN